MLNRFVLIAVFVPLAIVLVALAVANRGSASFTMDPFNPGNPALTWQMPLFVLLFAAVALGMVIGSLATWIRQGRYRKMARQRSQEAEMLRQAARTPAAQQVAANAVATTSLTRKASFAAGPPDFRIKMLTISADDVDRALTFPGLVDTLRTAFFAGAVQPVRHHHTIERPDGAASTLLLMPAWTDFRAAGASAGGYIGVKVVTVSPDNNALGKPAVMGLYLLLDGITGEPRALIDGQRLTQWRTACASALAASYLAREDASRLLIVGAGALAPFLARAHAAVRPIREIRIWNRTLANAEKVAQELSRNGLPARASEDLDSELALADIISSATISSTPLIKGALLKPGTHVDLVGAFTPDMRESDDDAIARARVYVDTRAGATKEAGDIVQPLASGVLKPEAIVADLHELARGERKGRETASEITLFKSVGAALEDLAAGVAVFQKLSA